MLSAPVMLSAWVGHHGRKVAPGASCCRLTQLYGLPVCQLPVISPHIGLASLLLLPCCLDWLLHWCFAEMAAISPSCHKVCFFSCWPKLAVCD